MVEVWVWVRVDLRMELQVWVGVDVWVVDGGWVVERGECVCACVCVRVGACSVPVRMRVEGERRARRGARACKQELRRRKGVGALGVRRREVGARSEGRPSLHAVEEWLARRSECNLVVPPPDGEAKRERRRAVGAFDERGAARGWSRIRRRTA